MLKRCNVCHCTVGIFIQANPEGWNFISIDYMLYEIIFSQYLPLIRNLSDVTRRDWLDSLSNDHREFGSNDIIVVDQEVALKEHLHVL